MSRDTVNKLLYSDPTTRGKLVVKFAQQTTSLPRVVGPVSKAKIMIRAGTPSDIAKIEQINPFAGSRELEIIEGRLSVIDYAGSVAGFVVESKKGLLGRPYIEYLAVCKMHRRKGLAIELVKAIEAKHPGKRLFISTESSNSAMLSLLEQSGYIHSGTISNANLSGADELYFFKQIA